MKGIWPAGVNSGSLSSVSNARTRIIEPHFARDSIIRVLTV